MPRPQQQQPRSRLRNSMLPICTALDAETADDTATHTKLNAAKTAAQAILSL